MAENSIVEILLVEDSPADLELITRALDKANVKNPVHIARDGLAALEFIFGEGPPAGRKLEPRPKLVLLDLKLPRVDGLEVLARLKKDPRTKTIPVIILATSREQQDLVEGYQLGVNSYIVKPVTLENFLTAVRELGMHWLLSNPPAE